MKITWPEIMAGYFLYTVEGKSLILIITCAIIVFEVKNMKFSEIVKLVRKKTGMSQDELARVLNVSFATINRWENGKTHPNKLTQAVFFDFCRQQGLNIESLKSGEE